MLTDDLFEQVLIQPAKEGADKLFIVSGFATASMAKGHMMNLLGTEIMVHINLIVGMVPLHGINKIQHRGFQDLNNRGDFLCHYLVNNAPCHAKTYIWEKADIPVVAFNGSANYTITGFSDRQQESMSEVDPNIAKKFYISVLDNSILCLEHDIQEQVKIIDSIKEESVSSNNTATLSFIQARGINKGEVPQRSSLNWGQRDNRNPNQAYIPVPTEIARSGFFPPRGERFTVLTDDNQSLVMVVAQDNDKALQTPEDNSIIGLYFRNRMGLDSGSLVTAENLQKYGRTDVEFYKVDQETYFMNFLSLNN